MRSLPPWLARAGCGSFISSSPNRTKFLRSDQNFWREIRSSIEFLSAILAGESSRHKVDSKLGSCRCQMPSPIDPNTGVVRMEPPTPMPTDIKNTELVLMSADDDM